MHLAVSFAPSCCPRSALSNEPFCKPSGTRVEENGEGGMEEQLQHAIITGKAEIALERISDGRCLIDSHSVHEFCC